MFCISTYFVFIIVPTIFLAPKMSCAEIMILLSVSQCYHVQCAGSRSLILGAVSVMRMAGLSVNVILRLALASVLLQMVEARQCRASSDCPAHSPHCR